MANTRTSLYKETRERLQKYFKDELFDTAIRTNEDINKAVGEGKTILDYKNASNGAEDYKKLIKEIIKREKK
jgi:chromosome partitioning protein